MTKSYGTECPELDLYKKAQHVKYIGNREQFPIKQTKPILIDNDSGNGKLIDEDMHIDRTLNRKDLSATRQEDMTIIQHHIL